MNKPDIEPLLDEHWDEALSAAFIRVSKDEKCLPTLSSAIRNLMVEDGTYIPMRTAKKHLNNQLNEMAPEEAERYHGNSTAAYAARLGIHSAVVVDGELFTDAPEFTAEHPDI